MPIPSTRTETRSARPPEDRPTKWTIYQALRHDIVTLGLTPGERLSENDLADRFGTSRAPVREALIRLAEDGLIEVRPQRGSYVAPISLPAMHHARFVREALEVAVVRRAAENGIPTVMERRLRDLVARQGEAAEDAIRFTGLDDLFHRTLAEAAGEGRVWAIVEREKVQFDRMRFLSLPRVTPVSTLMAQHLAMVEAIVRRDPRSAEAAVRAHLGEILKITRDLADRFPDLIVSDARGGAGRSI